MTKKHDGSLCGALEGLSDGEVDAFMEAEDKFERERIANLSPEELQEEINLACREMGITREEWDRRSNENLVKIETMILESKFGKPQGNA